MDSTSAMAIRPLQIVFCQCSRKHCLPGCAGKTFEAGKTARYVDSVISPMAVTLRAHRTSRTVTWTNLRFYFGNCFAKFGSFCSSRRRPTPERQPTRARQLVHFSGRSAARQTLGAGPLATGTADTLHQSYDPAQHPNEPYAHPSFRNFQPDPPLDLLDDIISINLNLAKERPEGHRYPPHPDGLRHRHQLATSSELPVTLPKPISQQTLPEPSVSVVLIWDRCRKCVAKIRFPKRRPKVRWANPNSFSTSRACLATRSGMERCKCSDRRHRSQKNQTINPIHTRLSVEGVGAFDNISCHRQRLISLPKPKAANKVTCSCRAPRPGFSHGYRAPPSWSTLFGAPSPSSPLEFLPVPSPC